MRYTHNKEKVEGRGVVMFVAAVATLLLLTPLHGAAVPAPAATGRERNCTRSCGNVGIPYPFGIEPGCYLEAGFNLTCDTSNRQAPRLFLGDGSVQVVEISVSDSTVRINSRRLVYTVDTGVSNVSGTWGLGLPDDGPFFLSKSRSCVAVVGCGTQVDVRGGKQNLLISSCTATCPLDGNQHAVVEAGNCMGIGCCQADIVFGYNSYNLQISKVEGSAYNQTTSVYLVDRGFSTEHMNIYPEVLPATLEWAISERSFACTGNNSVSREGTYNVGNRRHQCSCADGYQGNPYLPEGCQDTNECSNRGFNPCYGNCKNTEGGFICLCPTGYYGNASVLNGCKDINECENKEAPTCHGICQNIPGNFRCHCPHGTYGNPFTKGGCVKKSSGLTIGLGVCGGVILLLLAFFGPVMMRKIKQHKVRKMREKYFKQNHGLLLQQLISHKTDICGRMIINVKELEKATNRFDKAHIVGGGGHGVVYKGILGLQVVAIKKAKIIVQREIDEFINEVAVLSQVNHRNVVKLLGCCLETEVPLLVYEFISNGTLYHHIHVEGPVSLKWDDRIRIAMEVSRALSYLHSAASMPIFHRDIKSSNILLDDTLTAKLSDFGASRYVPIDRTGVTTAIQGTMGYLDPMYHYTGRLTDKSDVFSFGVLLLELLTRKKPFVYRSDGGEGLVSHFATLLTKGKLVDIIDPQVMEEFGEVQEVSILATMCTKLRGEDRPTMREVEMILGNLVFKKKQVSCNTEASDSGRDETGAFMPLEIVTTESSRQYTIEEEILLSGRYPR